MRLKCPTCNKAYLVEDEIQIVDSENIIMNCPNCKTIFHKYHDVKLEAMPDVFYSVKPENYKLKYVNMTDEQMNKINDTLDDALVNDVCDRMAFMKTHNCVFDDQTLLCKVCGKTAVESIREQSIHADIFGINDPFENMSDEVVAILLKDIQNAKQVFNKTEWHDVSKGDLPNIDEYVLWLHENGGMFEDCIDKDWDDNVLKIFLSGKRYTGKVIAWMKKPELPDWLEGK